MARILITDDAMFMRLMIKTTLTEGGHEIVAEAGTGREAVEQYEKHLPDLVTMDITMPDMDGIEAVKRIVAAHPDARIMMCSAMGQEGLVADAIKAGARSFVVKPFQRDKVLQEVAKLLF
jgi:two-component system, chemotaxis family, chemotaxis protein CheY